MLAAKLLEENSTIDQKIEKAFRLTFAGSPKVNKIPKEYYDDRNKTFKQDKQQTLDDLLAVGEYPMPPHPDKIMLTSLMQVVAAIYNLEESITKS